MNRESNARFCLIALRSCLATPASDADVLAFEPAMEAAVARGDLAYVDNISAPDLTFTHGDGWTTGGKIMPERPRASKRAWGVPRSKVCGVALTSTAISFRSSAR